jgi:murein DD-endopeptidase MepM/ murein hydrolase activator NlpD
MVPQPILVEHMVEVPISVMGGLSLDWPIKDHQITSRYGWRNDLRKGPTGGGDSIHLGIDLVPKDKTKIHALIFASAPGKVVIVYNRVLNQTFGRCAQIQHDTGMKSADGKTIYLYTFYAHLSEVDVSRGEVVERGQVIGRMGQTGQAEGYHLHFEVTFDPMDFLPGLN